MKTPGRILIVGLCLGIILAACSPATPAPTSIAPSPVSLPQPTSLPATPVPTPEPVGVGAPVIEYRNGRQELLVISSVTGKVFDSFTPIPLGDNYNYVFAPDEHSLAVVSNSQLYLIDLPSWKFRASDVGLRGWVSSVVYSPDGTLLALASGGSDGTFLIVDAKSGEIQASAQAGFSIRNAKFMTDGKGIMVYGPQLASTGIAANAGVSVGAPKAALFAVSDLSLLWSVDLNGIRDGVFPKKADTANTQDIYQPGAAWRYEPGVVFDPNRDVLYLVHGDEDKLTTVDFADRKVKTMNVRVKTSWLDQLMALTADVAYAKGMDGSTKQALISPDGKFLFVGGNTEVVTQQTNGSNWDITDTPLGLQVIATEDGTLVNKIETEASPTWLSSDGSQIFLSGWKRDNNGTPWTDVYDISTQRIVKRFDGLYLFSTRRLDGKSILASSNTINNNVSYMALVDPDTWTIVSEWKGTVGVAWLLDP